MDGDRPSAEQFEAVVGGLMDQVGARFPNRRIRAFGEMVDLLCERGNPSAAAALEELWNRLARRRSFSLLCGYRIDVFDRGRTGLGPAGRSAGPIRTCFPRAIRSASSGPSTRLSRRRSDNRRVRSTRWSASSCAGSRCPPAQLALDVGQLADAAVGRADPRVRQGALPGRAGRLSPVYGLTTIALPPPRRTGSAAASRRSPPRNSIPVAAPISAIELNTCPRALAARSPRPSRGRPSPPASAYSRIPLAQPRVRDRLRKRQAEIEPVEQDLQDGRDDRRPARRADREQRLAVAKHDRRAHRAAWPLAALDTVRVRQ